MLADVSYGSDWWRDAHAELGGEDTDAVYALLEGYQCIGFARVGPEGALTLPGGTLPEFAIDRLQDVRVFSARGEWHAWLASGKWRQRRHTAVPESNGYPLCSQLLWGDHEHPETALGWTVFSEARGPRVPAPEEAVAGLAPGVGLQVQLVISRDAETGQAGIVDAAILGFCAVPQD